MIMKQFKNGFDVGLLLWLIYTTLEDIEEYTSTDINPHYLVVHLG